MMFHIPALAEKLIKDIIIQMKCCYSLIMQEFSVALSEYLKQGSFYYSVWYFEYLITF